MGDLSATEKEREKDADQLKAANKLRKQAEQQTDKLSSQKKKLEGELRIARTQKQNLLAQLKQSLHKTQEAKKLEGELARVQAQKTAAERRAEKLGSELKSTRARAEKLESCSSQLRVFRKKLSAAEEDHATKALLLKHGLILTGAPTLQPTKAPKGRYDSGPTCPRKFKWPRTDLNCGGVWDRAQKRYVA